MLQILRVKQKYGLGGRLKKGGTFFYRYGLEFACGNPILPVVESDV